MDHLLRPWLHLDLIPTQQLSEICEAGLWATIIKTQNKKRKKTETRVIRAGVVEAWILFQISIYLKNYYWLIHSPIKQWLFVTLRLVRWRCAKMIWKAVSSWTFWTFAGLFRNTVLTTSEKKPLHNLKSLWTDFDLRLRTVNVKYLAGLFCIQFNIVLQKWRSLWSGI